MLQGLKQSAEEAFARLKLNATATPGEIVKAVNAAVLQLQTAGNASPSDPYDDDPVHFGSLWCEQLVSTLEWEWTQFTFHEHGDTKAIGVVSQDRSLMICPFHFVFGCLVNNAPTTIELSYHFLQNFNSPEVRRRMIDDPPKANAYFNVMDAVHHIVPPR